MKTILLAMFTLLLCAAVAQPNVVKADPTSTPIPIATGQFENLLPTPSPRPTSNATAMSLVDNDKDPKGVAYEAINTYRYFNQSGIFDWIAATALAIVNLIWLFKLIQRLRSS